MRRYGFPAYTTSTGWLGYPDEKVRRLCREAMAQGFTHFKMKVSEDREGNRRRAALMRAEIGRERRLSMDANQCWDVGDAIEHVRALAEFDPWWIEEPTSPDDVLGHAAIAKAIAPIKVATGEMCQNRVVFKQLFQAGALGYCQVDSCRVGGVNEVLAILLLAAKFGVPVCPHAGGVGLCEYVQHLAIYDYVALNPSIADRYCEYVDHLHEHFVEPVKVVGRALPGPARAGLLDRDEGSVPRRPRVPGRPCLELLSTEEAVTPPHDLSRGRDPRPPCGLPARAPGLPARKASRACSTASPPRAGCSVAARRSTRSRTAPSWGARCSARRTASCARRRTTRTSCSSSRSSSTRSSTPASRSARRRGPTTGTGSSTATRSRSTRRSAASAAGSTTSSGAAG